MKNTKQEQKEYRVVFQTEFHKRIYFTLETRVHGKLFWGKWNYIAESEDVTELCDVAKRLIALDKANGINSVFLTDEDIYLKERCKQ